MTDNKPLYKPFVSKAQNRKYSVYVKSSTGGKKLIHFGDMTNSMSNTKTKLKHYSSKDHKDVKHHKAYYDRHGPATDKNTAKYRSHKVLW